MGNDDISYNCPSCKSENIQRASVLVSSGSNKLRAATVGVSGGSSGINAGIGLSGGSITSELAAKLSPPNKPQPADLFMFKCITFPGLLLFIALCAYMFFSGGSLVGGFVTLGLLVFLIYYGYFIWLPPQEKQRVEYPQALAIWERTYFCLRCGSTFEIGETK
jgi:DNA-directed RNA polymerase subunit RPC12/RpoP